MASLGLATQVAFVDMSATRFEKLGFDVSPTPPAVSTASVRADVQQRFFFATESGETGDGTFGVAVLEALAETSRERPHEWPVDQDTVVDAVRKRLDPSTPRPLELRWTTGDGDVHAQSAAAGVFRYAYYASYALADEDPQLRSFLDELQGELRTRGGDDLVGYRELAQMRLERPTEAAAALASSRVLLAFLSPNYVDDPQLGREWQFFAQYRTTTSNVPAIIPVVWRPVEKLPPAIAAYRTRLTACRLGTASGGCAISRGDAASAAIPTTTRSSRRSRS